MTLFQARTTKVVLSGVLFLSGVVFLVPCGFANVVHVDNPSFQKLGGPLNEHCGSGCSFRLGSIPGWTTTGSVGQIHPSKGPHGIFDTFAPQDGVISAFSNGPTISQTVGPKVKVGNIYTLTVDIGHRNDLGFAGTADLLVGSTTFMAHGKTPSPGHWSVFTATFTGTAADAGDHITIQLNAPGAVLGSSQGNFDSVHLTATPIPEPGTLLLFGSGLLLLGIIVHRKQLRAKAGNIGLINVA